MASYITHVEIPEFRTIKGVEIDLRPDAGSERPFRHLILTGPKLAAMGPEIVALFD